MTKVSSFDLRSSLCDDSKGKVTEEEEGFVFACVLRQVLQKLSCVFYAINSLLETDSVSLFAILASVDETAKKGGS